MKKIAINIPTSTDELLQMAKGWKWTLKRSWQRTVFRVRGGFRCSACGLGGLKFGTMKIEGQVGRTRMMLEHCGDRTVPTHSLLCPACILAAIKQEFRESDQVYDGVCDFTGKRARVISSFEWSANRVIFGREWWNGWTASLEAFEEVLTVTGSVSSGSMNAKGYINKLGLTFPPQSVVDCLRRDNPKHARRRMEIFGSF